MALHAAIAAPLKPMPLWKRVHTEPAGAQPASLITKICVLLLTVLLAALIISLSLTNGSQDPAALNEDAQQVADPVKQRLAAQVRQESLRQEQRHAAQARDDLRRQQDEQTSLSGAQIQPAGDEAAGDLADLLSEAEQTLRDTLRLEEIERRTRSLRSLPVAQSYRVSDEGFAGLLAPPSSGPTAAAPATHPPLSGVAPTPSAEAALTKPAAQDPQQLAQSLALDYQQALALLQQAQSTPVPLAATAAPTSTDPFSEAVEDASPPRLSEPDDPEDWERIYEGSFLEAVLVTQLAGDFPGPVLASVSVPFYSRDRQRILVPRGARVLGTAQAVSNQDQERLAVSFHRLLFPDGTWISLQFHGLNQVGEGALKDRVNRRYFSMFAAAGAVGVLSGLTLQGSNPYAGGGAGFRAGAGQGLGQSAMRIMDRFLNRFPAITIRAGHRLRIWFTSDVLVPKST